MSDNYWQLLCSLERIFDLWQTKYVVSHTSSIPSSNSPWSLDKRLSLLYFVHNEEYLRCVSSIPSLNSLWTNTIYPSSLILGGQHPALLSDRSRKPLRVERTSPLTHSGATWGYLCTQLFAQQQLKILKYRKMLYISKH